MQTWAPPLKRDGARFPLPPFSSANDDGNMFRLHNLEAPSEVEFPSALAILRDVEQKVGHAHIVRNELLLDRRVSRNQPRAHHANHSRTLKGNVGGVVVADRQRV